MIISLLFIIGNNVTIYASNQYLSQLDNQSETESIAGITGDQIIEMAQNSPNSLSPIQGLVLWMFAILAFLKLAQKMDSLLQSLGLNVTQTGGRAVGDLIMAGMALKHIGGAVSKGMGMFGFGKGGGSGSGASGTNGSIGTRNIGGGSAPIPSGAPRNDFTPSNKIANSSSSNIGSSNPSNGAAGAMKNDSFLRGAFKAGVKGGLIGVGAYTTKAGISKVGTAVSTRFGNKDISPNPDEKTQDKNSSSTPNNASPISANANDSSKTHSVYNGENTEDYQTSQPFDGTENQTTIQTSNNEDFQDAKSSDGTDESEYSRNNHEEYNLTGSNSSTADVQSIPATGDSGSETWQSAKPVGDSKEVIPMPVSINSEGWHESKSSSQTASVTSATDSGLEASSSQIANTTPTGLSQTNDRESTTPHTSILQQDTTISQAGSIASIPSYNGNSGGSDADYAESYDSASIPIHNQTIEATNSTQTLTIPETIRTDLPLVQTDITMQSQTTQINDATKFDVSTQAPPMTKDVYVENRGYSVQPATQHVSDVSSRPTAKGKSKLHSAKGRKRRR